MIDNELKLEFLQYLKNNPVLCKEELDDLQSVFNNQSKNNILKTFDFNIFLNNLQMKYYDAYITGSKTMQYQMMQEIFDLMDKLKLYLDTLVVEEIIQPAIQEDILNICKNKFLTKREY